MSKDVEAYIESIVIRDRVFTHCPDGGGDLNEVTVQWFPLVGDPIVKAQTIQEAIQLYSGKEMYCELLAFHLAKDMKRLLADRGVSVTVRQLTGHGVEVEARA